MKEFQVITKKNCSKCAKLKDWFKDKGIEWTEWSVEDEEVVDKLLKDEAFIENFCDIEGCTVYTPLIHLEEDGKYYFKELFGIDGLREAYIKKLLDLNDS